MRFWKVSGPEYNENSIYLVTTQECGHMDLIKTLDNLFKTPDEGNYFIEEITRTQYDEATINW